MEPSVISAEVIELKVGAPKPRLVRADMALSRGLGVPLALHRLGHPAVID